jgi:hypothetical protein
LATCTPLNFEAINVSNLATFDEDYRVPHVRNTGTAPVQAVSSPLPSHRV